jgi:hypothetical protein
VVCPRPPEPVANNPELQAAQRTDHAEIPDLTHRPCYLLPYYVPCQWTLPLLSLSTFCRTFTHEDDLLLGLRIPSLTHSASSHPLTHSLLLLPHDLILSHCGPTLRCYSHMRSCSLLTFPPKDVLPASFTHYLGNIRTLYLGFTPFDTLLYRTLGNTPTLWSLTLSCMIRLKIAHLNI